MKLKRDIYSTFNAKHKYASAGDEVKIIGVIIVEGRDGERFPISWDDILKDGEIIETEKRILNKIPNKKQSKILQPEQNLF